MTPIETARLHDIACQTLKVWIEQQILETAQPPSNATCEDQVECVVNKAIDWRRDYISALTTALSFSTLAEYDSAINILGSKARSGKSQISQHIRDAADSTNSEDFNDAAQALLSPMAFSAQEIFLGKVRRIFIYLNGNLSTQEDFKHISLKPDSMTGSLFTIMQQNNVIDEWRALVSKTANGNTYLKHLTSPEKADCLKPL